MDKYTIFDQVGSATAVAPAREGDAIADCARRDLDAALQLLAERAQYLTGASGASIGLREGGEMVCRASAGQAAPEVGAEIDTHSGLTAESLRSGQVVRCDDAANDPQVNRERCQKLGVKSVMVVPLLHETERVGVFEVVADRTSAFEARDLAALVRLAEMALTAVEHCEAAQRALPEIAEAELNDAFLACESEAVEVAKPSETYQELPSATVGPLAAVSPEIARIGSCEACGFPVSQGRALCVDCEQAGRSAEPTPLGALVQEESWFQAHSYFIGAVAIAALTLALLALKMR